MKKSTIFIFFVALLISGLPAFVSAEKYIINIKGDPRTPDGKIDLMYSAGLVTDKGTIESETKIDNDNGFFEIKNAVLDTGASFNYVAPFAQGSCFLHSYRVMRKNNQFEVSDGYRSDQDILIATNNATIDLGILKEDMSNQVMVDFDVPVKFLAEDLSGNWVAENGGYSKFTGASNSFKSNSRYKLTLTIEDNKQIIKEITTGSYCESTRLIKRGSYYIEEHFPGNSFPQIGFFRNIWLSILGFRMIVIIPLVIAILIIITTLFLIIKRKRVSNNLT